MTARDNPTMAPDLITCSTGVDVFGLWEKGVRSHLSPSKKNQQSLMFVLSAPHAISSGGTTSVPH